MKCFKCEKELSCETYEGQEPFHSWDMPSGAVVFDGGNNYGSRLYDSIDGDLMVRILVCDECLRQGQGLIQHRNYINQTVVLEPPR